MQPADEMVMVLAWYSRDEWTKLKGLAADKEKLDDSYEEWKQQARELIESFVLEDPLFLASDMSYLF